MIFPCLVVGPKEEEFLAVSSSSLCFDSNWWREKKLIHVRFSPLQKRRGGVKIVDNPVSLTKSAKVPNISGKSEA